MQNDVFTMMFYPGVKRHSVHHSEPVVSVSCKPVKVSPSAGSCLGPILTSKVWYISFFNIYDLSSTTHCPELVCSYCIGFSCSNVFFNQIC